MVFNNYKGMRFMQHLTDKKFFIYCWIPTFNNCFENVGIKKKHFLNYSNVYDLIPKHTFSILVPMRYRK